MPRGRTAKYPWREWFGSKGAKVTLHKSKHFNCEPYSFMIQARSIASQLRISLKISITGNKVIILNNGKIKIRKPKLGRSEKTKLARRVANSGKRKASADLRRK